LIEPTDSLSLMSSLSPRIVLSRFQALSRCSGSSSGTSDGTPLASTV